MTDKISIERNQVESAINAVRSLHKKHLEENAGKKPLLEEVDEAALLLQINLKKIPHFSSVKMIKIPLPHPLLNETTEVCLFTGDLDKRDRKADIEPTVLHYKELLKKNGINFVSEVVPIRQLRTDYKPHEAKRQLAAAYDYFLAEDTIAAYLPKVLGKSFFKKRRFPQQVNLKSTKLKAELLKALSNTRLFVTGRGNTCCLKVAQLGWETENIVDNIMGTIDVLQQKLPGSTPNIDGLYLKTEKSKALPLYVSFESGNDVELPEEPECEDEEPEEISTLSGAKVKIHPDGTITLVPKDNNDGSSESDSDLENILSEDKKRESETIFLSNKRRKLAYPKKSISVAAQ